MTDRGISYQENARTFWPEQWAVQAAVAADRIEHRLALAVIDRSGPAVDEARAAVESHLAHARAACRSTGRRRRRGLRDRWRGTSVEKAYRHLHAAQVFLADVLPEPDLDAMVPDVATRLAVVLDRNDSRRVELERLLRVHRGPARRAAIEQATAIGYDASDEMYGRLRDFRNVIIMTAIAVAALTTLLIAVVALFPDAVPLCFDPVVTGATTIGEPAAQRAWAVCPSGDGRPVGGDIVVVAGLGAVGGALGALIAVRNLRGSSTPYTLSTALAVLKVPTGALSAVIGMVLLSGGFIPGLTSLDSQPQTAAYAVIFGLAQHLVTRLVDARAQQILDRLPSKDSETRFTQPSVVLPSPPATAAPLDRAAPAAEAQRVPAGEPIELPEALVAAMRDGQTGFDAQSPPGAGEPPAIATKDDRLEALVTDKSARYEAG